MPNKRSLNSRYIALPLNSIARKKHTTANIRWSSPTQLQHNRYTLTGFKQPESFNVIVVVQISIIQPRSIRVPISFKYKFHRMEGKQQDSHNDSQDRFVQASLSLSIYCSDQGYVDPRSSSGQKLGLQPCPRKSSRGQAPNATFWNEEVVPAG